MRRTKILIGKEAGIITADLVSWAEQGITCLLCDIEGTLTPWGESAVEPAVLQKLAEARRAGIAKIGLITNIPPSKVAQIKAVAAAVQAEVYCFPLKHSERKPSSTMVQRAMGELGVLPEHTAMIGDKLVDVLAAQRAQVNRVMWVKRLGEADNAFDKLLYRPIEPLLRRLMSIIAARGV